MGDSPLTELLQWSTPDLVSSMNYC
jgi:hypothetical protein